MADRRDEPVIRAARPADVPAMAALIADDVRGRLREDLRDLTPYQRAFATIAADPNHLLLVLEERGQLVAVGQLSFLPGLAYQGGVRAQIESVHVRADRQGQGLGAALVRHMTAEARRRGCVLAQLTSHADRVDAHRFYQRLGFAPSHVGFKLPLTDAEGPGRDHGSDTGPAAP